MIEFNYMLFAQVIGVFVVIRIVYGFVWGIFIGGKS